MIERNHFRTSLVGQRLRLCAPNAGGPGSIPGQRTKIPQLQLRACIKVKVTQACATLCDPMDLYSPWNSPGQNTGEGSPSLLQGIFPTQGSNPGLLHCRRVLYQLSHQGSPRMLECSLSLLQWIFPTQEANWGLLHCRQIFYPLSYQEAQRVPTRCNEYGRSRMLQLRHSATE